MIFIETDKRLKAAALFEARTLEEIAEQLKALNVKEVMLFRHIASSQGVNGTIGKFYELITPHGAIYTFYTSNIYNDFTELNEKERLNKLLTESEEQ